MRTLRIAARPCQQKNTLSVHWHLEESDFDQARWQGICEVGISPDESAGTAIAEIHALYYLLSELRIFGPQNVPHNCRVCVTCPEVPELITETSANSRLIPLGSFLYFAVPDGSLTTNPETEWVKTLPVNPDRVFIVPARSHLAQFLDVPSIGRIRLTRHAAQRFEERYCAPRNEPLTPVMASKKIHRLLSHSSVQKIALSGRSRLNALLSHHREADLYTRPDLNVAFVVATDAEGLYMPTVISCPAGRMGTH